MTLSDASTGRPWASASSTTTPYGSKVLGTMSAIPIFWQLPNLLLTGSAAACGIALINSIANLAGFGAPWFLGVVKTSTGQFTSGLYTVSAIEAVTLVLILAFIPRKKLD